MIRKNGPFCYTNRMDVQKIYFTLVREGSFSLTVNVLDNCFIPKANVPLERPFSGK